MHLRSVTLKGFKSFPDRTRLEFSPGVSVVVGPNGSGKSNITDAVLWAMGEQSPLAVRGQSMQDVIFAGAHGVTSRSEAEVEVVLDNGDGAVDLPAGEIAISRKLTRSGDGEYRINGARCRLGDVIEVLSDTGLGREMHSVVSQGRVESIVTSKPRDRRMLIEEAAGLGKHRKRRRRAQLKLERTQENLSRAFDVEREARSRLRPLKRQADAAELHARLQRQADEAHWELAQDAALGATTTLAEAEAAVAAARADVEAAERELASVSARRRAAEEALSARAAERERLQGRAFAARSAHERVESRLEAARAALAELDDRRARREGMIAALEAEATSDTDDDGAAERIARLEAQLAGLERDRAQRLAREVAELEAAHAATTGTLAEAETAARAAAGARAERDRAVEAARGARREVEAAADRARRDSARIGAELAKVNQVLRTHAGAPGGAAALADGLHADPGFELALAAALGPRLRAAVAEDLQAGSALLDRAGGRDGGAALVAAENAAAAGDEPPSPGAQPLLDHVRHEGAPAARRVLATLLADIWVVADVHAVAAGFRGLAVTRAGRVWSPATGELRQVTGGGEDRVLAERNRRDTLIAETGRAARAEQAAQVEVDTAGQAVAAADAAREAADGQARAAARARDDAAEVEQRARRAVEQRRAAPDDTPAAERRRELEASLAAERRLTQRLAREREQRRGRIAAERSRLEYDAGLRPVAERLAAALERATAAVGEEAAALRAALDADREAGDRLTAELREGATAEAAVQTRLKERGEVVTRGEVRAQQARDRGAEAAAELRRLAQRLGLDPAPADAPLEAERRTDLEARIERLARRREQLGPVNPLAQDEYTEAVAHVDELERRREDLETALRELEGLIRDTDRRIKEAFEQTFAAAAANFEEVAAQLFPGGRGRLRLVSEHSGPRPVRDGEEAAAEALDPEQRLRDDDEDAERDDDVPGVEIEITPAGKATKRLSLLSGGEKSMTALAFLFAVFLARPCPFYILDEVEAALDDLNIDRFLTLLGRVSDRAQFIVVTHQKRTMEAADCLYGVSMAGNGVSKVISRRLPPRESDESVPAPREAGYAA